MRTPLKDLYAYHWSVGGDGLKAWTETWTGEISREDPRIKSRLETAPGRGLLWTHEDIKEEQ